MYILAQHHLKTASHSLLQLNGNNIIVAFDVRI